MIDAFLYQHPVFRYEEFAAWKLAQTAVQPSSLKMSLQYYQKTGKVIHIRRELYAAVPAGQKQKTIIVDPYLVAAKAAPDSVLAYHTALELHGVAYSSFGQQTYFTLKKNKPFKFQNVWYQAVTPALALKKTKQTSMYTQTMDRQGLNIQVTNSARTFVDILDRVELSGGWEEVCRAMNNMAVLNIDEVVQYCLMLNNAGLAAKVGYFLEQRQGAFAINETQLQPLLAAKPKIPQYVCKQKNAKHKLIKKWNILLPLSVIQQSWEEPNVGL